MSALHAQSLADICQPNLQYIHDVLEFHCSECAPTTELDGDGGDLFSKLSCKHQEKQDTNKQRSGLLFTLTHMVPLK